MNKLFTLEDIKPQLNEKQIKEIEHIIYMAKELSRTQDAGMQMFQLGEKKIVVLGGSGKMMFFPDKEEVCEHCGAKK